MFYHYRNVCFCCWCCAVCCEDYVKQCVCVCINFFFIWSRFFFLYFFFLSSQALFYIELLPSMYALSVRFGLRTVSRLELSNRSFRESRPGPPLHKAQPDRADFGILNWFFDFIIFRCKSDHCIFAKLNFCQKWTKSETLKITKKGSDVQRPNSFDGPVVLTWSIGRHQNTSMNARISWSSTLLTVLVVRAGNGAAGFGGQGWKRGPAVVFALHLYF